MKASVFFAIFFFSSFSFAQKKQPIQAPEMPVNKETDLVTYTGVVETVGTASELYKRGLNWFNTFYKNPTEVIREKTENEKIFGKARFYIYGKGKESDVKTNDGIIMYDITLQFKEGKFRYEITKINWKQPSYFGIEKWVEENKKAYHEKYSMYLVQIDEYTQDLITKMKTAVSTAETKKKEDW